METDARILVFAKAPVAGQVKTRLQPQLTPMQSAVIHRALVTHCLGTVTRCNAATVELWCGSKHQWWDQLATEYPIDIYFQRGADLGERMSIAADEALLRANCIIIVGTDCPFITVEYLQDAVAALKNGSDVVLGPAEDGGYVLIGLNKKLPVLFDNICWGSDQVFKQTLDRLQCNNIAWTQLHMLTDIDRPQDVDRVKQLLPRLAAQFELE